jgi:hypothetical protein
MALKITKHDPSQPPPVIGPRASHRRFAVLYVLACFLSAFMGVVAISNIRPDHRYVSFLGGDNDWRPIQQLTTLCGVFGAIVFALALAMPLWIGKRGGFQLAICSLILSVAYLGCAAGMTTISMPFYVLVGTLNAALAAVAVVLTPPKS